MALIHATYPEILTGAPNGEGREDKTYKLSKKKSHPQGCQLDLNLRPESWRLPHQTQSCLARLLLSCAAWGRTDIMISSCRCCGVPDLLRVPSPSSCGWVLNR